MRQIKINDTVVEVTPKTYRKIETLASAKQMTFAEAVFYCLKRSIDPTPSRPRAGIH